MSRPPGFRIVLPSQHICHKPLLRSDAGSGLQPLTWAIMHKRLKAKEDKASPEWTKRPPTAFPNS